MFEKLNRFLRNFFNYGDYKVSIVCDSVSPKNVRLTTFIIEGELTITDKGILFAHYYNVYTVGNKNLVTGCVNPFGNSRIEKIFKKLRMANKPDYLKNAQWHIPFKKNIDYTKLYFYIKNNEKDFGKCGWCEEIIIDSYMLKVAVGRCIEINTAVSHDFEHDLNVYKTINKEAMKHVAQAQNDFEIYDMYHCWKPADLFLTK